MKETIQIVSWIVAIVAGSIAATVAILQMRSGLRWRQANAAKESINAIHANDWSLNAVAMLDMSEAKHPRLTFIKEGNQKEISWENDVIPALKKSYDECTDLEQDIAYSFDWFFFFMDRIEHYLETKLVKFEDVKDVFRPYSQKLKKNREVFEKFMLSHSYPRAVEFWKRYYND